jgi:hypothetical protein
MTDSRGDPKSHSFLERDSLEWRLRLGVQEDNYCPDVIRIVENIVPEHFDDFVLIVLEKGSVPPQEGLSDTYYKRMLSDFRKNEAVTYFDPLRTYVSEELYWQCVSWEPRSRFTIAHELGHLIYHGGLPKARGRTAVYIRPFESTEWHANAFARKFLMPGPLLVKTTEASELVEKCGVTDAAAEYRLSERERLINEGWLDDPRSAKKRPLTWHQKQEIKDIKLRNRQYDPVRDAYLDEPD